MLVWTVSKKRKNSTEYIEDLIGICSSYEKAKRLAIMCLESEIDLLKEEIEHTVFDKTMDTREDMFNYSSMISRHIIKFENIIKAISDSTEGNKSIAIFESIILRCRGIDDFEEEEEDANCENFRD